MRRALVVAALILGACGRGSPPQVADAGGPHPHAHAASDGGAHALAEGLGSYHRAISCADVARGAWFDEGLHLYYAFDLEGAEQAFRKASAPAGCAITRWGVALALGPNINVPRFEERRRAAMSVLSTPPEAATPPVERGLYEALVKRYATDDAAADNLAYVARMRTLHAAFPEDADVAALFAASLLDLHPFAQWSPKGVPADGTPELVALLEAALARAPEHPGLNHYYIHTMESSPHPERALIAAGRIGTMMPAAGHLVHMPSHVFLRTGQYAEAAERNRRAIAADERWVAAGRAGPLYQMYPLHNHHFLWLATLMLGRHAEAKKEAEALVAAATPEAVSAMAGMEALIAVPAITAVRFSDWSALLALPIPLRGAPFALGLVRFARVRAFVGVARYDEAKRELEVLDAHIGGLPKARMMGANTAIAVLTVAADAARGDLMSHTGKLEEAVRVLKHAVEREDALLYDEPPSWSLPTRQLLGRVLLDCKRYAEAAKVFEDDLRRNPENGWSLGGLLAARTALEQSTAPVRARLQRAFAEADEGRAAIAN